MPVQKQLSVFLENKPGVLARLLDSFSEHKINIHAIAVSDAADHAVVRIVVSKPLKAIHLLEERGVLVVETDVLELKLTDKPGALARISEGLARAKVNIEYAYGTANKGSASSLIMRVSDIDKALRILKKSKAKKTKAKKAKKTRSTR